MKNSLCDRDKDNAAKIIYFRGIYGVASVFPWKRVAEMWLIERVS